MEVDQGAQMRRTHRLLKLNVDWENKRVEELWEIQEWPLHAENKAKEHVDASAAANPNQGDEAIVPQPDDDAADEPNPEGIDADGEPHPEDIDEVMRAYDAGGEQIAEGIDAGGEQIAEADL